MSDKIISDVDFRKVYEQTVEELFAQLGTNWQHQMSKNNVAWDLPFDFLYYYKHAWRESYTAYQSLMDSYNGNSVWDCRICDLGGFLGVLPLTLIHLGFKNVSMTEALQYYDDSFDKLYDYLRKMGVNVIDYDIFGDSSLGGYSFDFISIIDVLEHYPYSLKGCFKNIRGMMANPHSVVFILVPNFARINNRIRFLKGETTLSDIETIWQSAIPFTGHCHEFTRKELRSVANLSGLEVFKEYSGNNYCKTNSFKLKTVKMFFYPFKNCRDYLACLIKG